MISVVKRENLAFVRTSWKLGARMTFFAWKPSTSLFGTSPSTSSQGWITHISQANVLSFCILMVTASLEKKLINIPHYMNIYLCCASIVIEVSKGCTSCFKHLQYSKTSPFIFLVPLKPLFCVENNVESMQSFPNDELMKPLVLVFKKIIHPYKVSSLRLHKWN